MNPVVENGIVITHMIHKQHRQMRSKTIHIVTKNGLTVLAMPFFTTG